MVEDSNLQRRSYGGNRSPQPGDKPGGWLILAAFLRQRPASFEYLQPNNAALSERAMSDTIQRKNPRYGFFDGRNEKRLSMSVPVYLTGMREPDRKSTRLNSSHGYISYAVFCLKKKKKILFFLYHKIKKKEQNKK